MSNTIEIVTYAVLDEDNSVYATHDNREDAQEEVNNLDACYPDEAPHRIVTMRGAAPQHCPLTKRTFTDTAGNAFEVTGQARDVRTNEAYAIVTGTGVTMSLSVAFLPIEHQMSDDLVAYPARGLSVRFL